MSATTTEAARIASAECCIEVLRQVMRSTDDSRKSVAEEFELKDAAYAEMMAAAGHLSPQAAGVLGALVDFALDSLQNGYGLREQLESEFAPETSMTAEDVRLARATFAGRLSGLEDELNGRAAPPGEPGGPKRELRTSDHRGFDVGISKMSGGDIYSAFVGLPNRESVPDWPWIDFAPGVSRRNDLWADEYKGTAMALVNAGIVRFDQLPGQPGMRKTVVTIFPDGTLPSGSKTVSREPGAKQIRASKDTYSVRVFIDMEEQQRRDTEYQQMRWEWEARMRNLPRPAPLIDLGDDAIPPVKAKPAPKYRADGNVLHLLPRAERRAAL